METQFRVVDETWVDEKGVDKTSSRQERSKRTRYQSLAWTLFSSRSFTNFVDHCPKGPSKGFIGASLSEPHTSVIALAEVCVCLLAAIYRKILNEHVYILILRRSSSCTRCLGGRSL